MMNTLPSRLVLLGICILGLASWALADAQSDYKTLFGAEEAKVVAKRNTRDSAAFAAKLLNAAKALTEQKDLQALLCEKAYEFAPKDASGQQTAADALKLLLEAAPQKKAQVQERLIKTFQIRYARSTGADRKRLGEELVDMLASCGDERAEAKAPAEAVAFAPNAASGSVPDRPPPAVRRTGSRPTNSPLGGGSPAEQRSLNRSSSKFPPRLSSAALTPSSWTASRSPSDVTLTPQENSVWPSTWAPPPSPARFSTFTLASNAPPTR